MADAYERKIARSVDAILGLLKGWDEKLAVVPVNGSASAMADQSGDLATDGKGVESIEASLGPVSPQSVRTAAIVHSFLSDASQTWQKVA